MVKDNPELEKDAIFLDNLGTLLSTSDTSDKFIPFMSNFKRNYIAARRAIKKRMLCSKEKVVAIGQLVCLGFWLFCTVS